MMKSVEKSFLADALKAYENGQLTLWRAAKKAGLSLWEMMDECQRKQAQVPYSVKDFAEDMGKA
ncbi:MAG TPA: hypothetical protein HA252_00270 [Candidatus Diapherotrites archaeon]|uniref:UPF0175 family protein n=1 Tax=Candidatus Iainarchaeum sp. TaxID=3101447 RepID=A0A7J4JKN5_9ARCH|nr:UPF0175 family protein [Candidatus Diapherotrites archaeon]HIH15826.1 hypothetical protein [Candidatus Diapherotrites archaeon]